QKTRPAFAFGHGLSYTTFALSNLRASRKSLAPSDSISFTVTVANTGHKAGGETVQLYIHDVESSVDRPYKELKGFQKVFLQPGESRDVTITIGRDALSFWSEQDNGWRAEPGEFEALVGTASDDLPLKAAFTLE
ncbi:MAG: fibronectin type III-like domain-contianing protein, partial [Prevotella sp.]